MKTKEIHALAASTLGQLSESIAELIEETHENVPIADMEFETYKITLRGYVDKRGTLEITLEAR